MKAESSGPEKPVVSSHRSGWSGPRKTFWSAMIGWCVLCAWEAIVLWYDEKSVYLPNLAVFSTPGLFIGAICEFDRRVTITAIAGAAGATVVWRVLYPFQALSGVLVMGPILGAFCGAVVASIVVKLRSRKLT